MSVCADVVVEIITPELIPIAPRKPACDLGQGINHRVREQPVRAMPKGLDRWHAVLLPASILLNATILFAATEAWNWIRP